MQEVGLVGVILLLGTLLTVFGGSVQQKVRDPETQETYLVTKNKFLNVDRLVNLAKSASYFAIMAIGATIVIVCGGIDLSVGGIYAVAGLAGAFLLYSLGPSGAGPPLPGVLVVVMAAVACLATGMLCGCLNGLGTVGLGLHPFIVTLGTMSIFRGLAFVTTEGQTITEFHPAFTEGFISYPVYLNQATPIYPIPLVIMVLLGLWGSFFLVRTVTGRKLYAIGGNETAARYSGLAVNRLKIWAYTLAGLTAGIAAMINIGYNGAAASGDGKGYELRVIAAAVVGGASLSGGRGTALGAVLGAIIIQLIDVGIVILGLDQNYSEIIIGSVIIAAAALDHWQNKLRSRA